MRRLIIVSNRLPLVIRKTNDGFAIREGAGGLVTAIKPLLAERGGAWIGFSGMFDRDRGSGWQEKLAEYGEGNIKYYAITPAESRYDGYYAQYSNQELWPRFHSMTNKMTGEATRHWPEYVEMNQLFAERTLEVADADSLIWVQDYHLMLLPKLLRKEKSSATIGHFLHIPFPPAEIMKSQPHAKDILEGVLGADLLGFHIPAYMTNFLETVQAELGVGVVHRDETRATMDHDGRRIRLGVFPIGIKPSQLKREPDVATVRRRLQGVGETVVVSMDRLDYTKAIPPRLEGFNLLLEQHPEYREKVSLVQLVDLSRKTIPAYREERLKVDKIVEQIGQQYDSWTALFFAAERWKRKEVAGLMRLAEVCLVTPRCDGMNLVAKEYVAVGPEDGVLVLSRQAGAAWQFGEHAVVVDGTSPESVAEGLHRALEMPRDERRARMQKLKENVSREDVFWWAGRFLEQLRVRESPV
jgi:trehalose 6-phosphate synthase/phosphatase